MSNKVSDAIQALKNQSQLTDAEILAAAIADVESKLSAVVGIPTLTAAAEAFGNLLALPGNNLTVGRAKERLAAAARAAKIGNATASGIADDGIAAGMRAATAAMVSSPKYVLANAVAGILKNNPSDDQAAATAYELLSLTGIHTDDVARSIDNPEAFSAALFASNAKTAEIDANKRPAECLLKAVEAAAAPDSDALPVELFNRITAAAKTLEDGNRVLLPGDFEEEAGILAEIEKIRQTPTLEQLRLSTLACAVPSQQGRVWAGGSWADVKVSAPKVDLVIFRRLAAVLIESQAANYTHTRETLALVDAK